MVHLLESKGAIPQEVGTQEHLNFEGEQQAGQRAATDMDWQGLGDLVEPELRVYKRGALDDEEIPRDVLSDIDAGGHDGSFAASAVIKIPWLLVSCLGLFLSIVPRVRSMGDSRHYLAK